MRSRMRGTWRRSGKNLWPMGAAMARTAGISLAFCLLGAGSALAAVVWQ